MAINGNYDKWANAIGGSNVTELNLQIRSSLQQLPLWYSIKMCFR